MPQRITKKRVDEFIVALRECDGSSGNKSLREYLQWNEEFYWKVQGKLVEDGKIVPGRGKGGSVTLYDVDEIAGIDEHEQDAHCYPDERSLYSPIAETIRNKWINRFGFDDNLVEETHSRGSKNTGGTFTRPDLTSIGVRRYEFLPKRLEIVTFEIKAAGSVGIMGVLEALAHKEAAHRAYVLYAVSSEKFEKEPESDRIVDLAQKYGIGIVAVEDPRELDTWEIILDALPNQPDYARLDRFLSDLPNDNLRKQIHKWKD